MINLDITNNLVSRTKLISVLNTLISARDCGFPSIINQFGKRTMPSILFNILILLFSATGYGFPSIINQFALLPPFRKRTMASILFALWTPNHNRRLIDGFSTAQRQHSKSPVRKVPCFSGRILSLSIIFTS